MGRYYFFPKIPLHVCTPANAARYLKMDGWLERTVGLRNDPKYPDSYLLPSLEKDGQLDPLFVKLNEAERKDKKDWDKLKWIVEPGQGRWYCLTYLGKKDTFVLAKVDDDGASKFAFERDLAKYEHREIKTFKESLSLFKATNEHSHTGPGYMKRRGWFAETGYEV